MKEDGVSFADIQKEGNNAYQRLAQDERLEYGQLDARANENLSTFGSISKEKMVKRIIANIQSKVSYNYYLLKDFCVGGMLPVISYGPVQTKPSNI